MIGREKRAIEELKITVERISGTSAMYPMGSYNARIGSPSRLLRLDVKPVSINCGENKLTAGLRTYSVDVVDLNNPKKETRIMSNIVSHTPEKDVARELVEFLRSHITTGPNSL